MMGCPVKSARCANLPNGPIVRLLAASRDIALARQSEEALRESEERFRLRLSTPPKWRHRTGTSVTDISFAGPMH